MGSIHPGTLNAVTMQSCPAYEDMHNYVKMKSCPVYEDIQDIKMRVKSHSTIKDVVTDTSQVDDKPVPTYLTVY